MTAQLAYSTRHPELIKMWLDISTERDELWKRRREYQKEITERLPTLQDYRGKGDPDVERGLYAFTRFDGSSGITGVGVGHGERSNPPVGWRYEKSKGHLVPAKRTPEGKAIVQEWRDRKLHGRAWMVDLEKFSIPTTLDDESSYQDGQGHMYFPGFRLVEDELFVLWGTVNVADEFEKRTAGSGVEWTELSRKELAALLDSPKTDA